MGSGFLLLYKRFKDGSLAWPRTTQEAADITQEQFRILMLGLNPLDPKIKEVHPCLLYTSLLFNTYFIVWKPFWIAICYVFSRDMQMSTNDNEINVLKLQKNIKKSL